MDHRPPNAAVTYGGNFADLNVLDADLDDNAVDDALPQAHQMMADDQLLKNSTVVVIAASPTMRCVVSLTKCLMMNHLDCISDKVPSTCFQLLQHHSRMAFDRSIGDGKRYCS